MARLIMLILFLGLIFSCAQPQVKLPEITFYVTPPVSYLYESPSQEGNILGPLYRGDKVERLNGGESAWWQVKLLRSGQAGWLRKELLSPNPVPSAFYYVIADSLPLLECPRSDCLTMQLLSRGEPVQRVEVGAQGWWRILVLKSRSIGWVPGGALVERSAEVHPPQAPYYYVGVRKLNLRATPVERSEVIRVLQFNDQVQKLAETAGWFEVRQPAIGASGWVKSRDLEPLPLIAPRGAPSREEPKPFIPKEEPQVEPEFM